MNLWKRINAAIEDYIQSWHEAAERTRRTSAEIDARHREAFGLSAEPAAIEDKSEGTNGKGRLARKGAGK